MTTVKDVYDALILAGGTARRLGGVDKPALSVGTRTLLEHVVAAVSDASRIVVVGPRRPLAVDVVWCVEDPPGGGPVAAIAAGLAHCTADVVLVLAADLPGVAPAVPSLLSTLTDGALGAPEVTVLVDASGRDNHLAAAWRRPALELALARLGATAGAAVRRLLDGVQVARVTDPAEWGRDCDTWDDLAAARREVR